MKVLVLNGSPKMERSDTMVLTNSFLKGLNEKQEHNINIIHVNKLNIRPCIGCFYCWGNKEGKCIQQDDQAMIMKEYEEADLIIWSFPLYSYSMPSQIKAVLDRLIPFNKMTIKEVNGRIVHMPRVDLSSKKVLFIVGSGFPTFEENFKALKIMVRNKFGPNAQMLCISETPMLNEKDARPLTEPLIIKFEQVGKKYNLECHLTEEDKEELEKPMLDKESYIKIVNSLR